MTSGLGSVVFVDGGREKTGRICDDGTSIEDESGVRFSNVFEWKLKSPFRDDEGSYSDVSEGSDDGNSEIDYATCSVRELKQMLRDRGFDPSKFFEKREIIEALSQFAW
eukprot:TRINITY_DN80235_c0_g1_i1.p1 TRINITY_DN80235_c0_g1~~TRINITY_DN80235_c0_g1_i1.p1  ORF type:complete len:109 (-),score=35.75 TRINITY_DN80235_c0_g1_i1:260-586(-)